MIVVDASVVIALLDARDAQHEKAVAALGSAGDPLAASVVTIAEILVGPARAGRLAAARAALAGLELASIPIDADGASRLAELRTETGLKLPDCCVLLAAEESRATTVLSFDDRLRSAAATLGLQAP